MKTVKADKSRKSRILDGKAVDDGYSFIHFLANDPLDPAARKGQKTKARLVRATAELLEQNGYRGLTHSDVCNAADISVATFYHHFENKNALCKHVMTAFFTFISTLRDSSLENLFSDARHDKDPYGSIFISNLQYLKLVSKNRGLFRCLLQFNGETDELTHLWTEFSDEWSERSASRVCRAFPDLSSDVVLLKTHLASSMVDDFARRFFVIGDDTLLNLCRSQTPTFADLASLITDTWYGITVGYDLPTDRDKWALSVARKLEEQA